MFRSRLSTRGLFLQSVGSNKVTRSSSGKTLSQEEQIFATGATLQKSKEEARPQYVFEALKPSEQNNKRSGSDSMRTYVRRGLLAGTALLTGTAVYTITTYPAEVDEEFLESKLSTRPLPSRESEHKDKEALEALRQQLVSTSTSLRTMWTPSEEAYPGTFSWEEVAPTLQPGDLILVNGTGGLSQWNTRGSHVYNGFSRKGIRYSHVGMVLDAVESKTAEVPSSHAEAKKTRGSGGWFGTSSKTTEKAAQPVVATPSEERRSPIKVALFEAVDNKDSRLPDWRGKRKFKAVQVVDAEKRIFGKDFGRWCYNRATIRRLHGIEWTKEKREKLKRFVADHEDMDLNQDFKLALSYVHPILYDLISPPEERRNKILCSELVYKCLSEVLDVLPREGSLAISGWTNITHAPYWFGSAPSWDGAPRFRFWTPSGFLGALHYYTGAETLDSTELAYLLRPTFGSTIDEALSLHRARRQAALFDRLDKLKTPKPLYGPEIRLAMPGAADIYDGNDPDTLALKKEAEELRREKEGNKS